MGRLPTNCAVFVPLSPDLRVSRTFTPVMAGLFVTRTLTPRLTTASSWTWQPTKSRTASSSRLEIYVWLLEVLTQGGWAPWCLGRSILAPSILSTSRTLRVMCSLQGWLMSFSLAFCLEGLPWNLLHNI